ncbi:MAG: carbohydrate ABC transporter permease [Hyphomicrobiales bacterium]|nr:carbohydrate ABC transporter permease [Hyphomicrobiales bacterium]
MTNQSTAIQATTRQQKAKTRLPFASVAANFVLISLASVVALPYVWMVLSAARLPDEIFTNPFGFPTDFTILFQNISQAFKIAPVRQFLTNGFIVVSAILLLQLSIAIPCAYALAKFRFPGRSLLLALVIAALCVPIQVPMLPIYIGLALTKQLNTYFSLILPFVISPFAIFLLRQHFMTYPDEIIQAARLDGFTEFEIMTRLMLPGARPVIAAFAVFSITTHWNDLFWPMITVSSLTMATPPLGLLYFRDGDIGANYGALLAGALVVVAPMMLVFFIAQRQFIRGMTMTGLR